MNKKVVFKYKFVVFIVLFIALAASFLFGVAPRENAYAARQKVMTAEQSEDVVYCGKNFIDASGKLCDTDVDAPGFNNDLFDSFVFKLDGQEIDVSVEDVLFETISSVQNPGQYALPVTVFYDNVYYRVSSVNFAIKKRTVTVLTLLNGKTDLTVNEGDDISISYDYQNAVPAHTMQVSHNGVSVTEIRSEYITIPAWTDVDITRPIENCHVVAAHAESDYYDFVYTGAILTILPATVKTLSFSDEKSTRLVLVGDFSVLHSMRYTDIGIDPSGEDFSVISANADVIYKDTGFFDKYEKKGCFSVEMFYNNNVVTESVPAEVAILASSLDTSKKYKVVALYNNGRSEVLDAKLNDGFLRFNASDMGDFIIVSEIQGLSITYYVLVIVGAVALIVIIILLISVFRRKY